MSVPLCTLDRMIFFIYYFNIHTPPLHNKIHIVYNVKYFNSINADIKYIS